MHKREIGRHYGKSKPHLQTTILSHHLIPLWSQRLNSFQRAIIRTTFIELIIGTRPQHWAQFAIFKFSNIIIYLDVDLLLHHSKNSFAMVVLSVEGGQIAVQLMQLTSGDDEITSFDEYCTVAQTDTLQTSLKRYVVAQGAVFGAKITIKRGFRHGCYDGGFLVSLTDMDSGHKFYARKIFKDSISWSGKVYQTEEDFVIDEIGSALLDGGLRKDTRLSFQAMRPRMFQSPESSSS
jgi:hypothetical protein